MSHPDRQSDSGHAAPPRGTRVSRRTVRTGTEERPPDGVACPRNRYVMIGMISSATMFATLIIGLIAGPAVSL